MGQDCRKLYFSINPEAHKLMVNNNAVTNAYNTMEYLFHFPSTALAHAATLSAVKPTFSIST